MLIVKFRGLIDKIIQVLSTIIMGVMVIAVCWQVITRYILNNPSTVTEEALRYLLIWVTMVGGAYAYGRRKHLAITALSKRLSFKGQKIRVKLIRPNADGVREFSGILTGREGSTVTVETENGPVSFEVSAASSVHLCDDEHLFD